LARRLELVFGDAELHRRLASNAERRMRTEFTREAATPQMGEVYREFLERAY